MPANIIGALIARVQSELEYTAWDGEVPKNAEDGMPITLPESFPIITIDMPEEGYGREWTTEDAYGDEGNTFMEVWGTTRGDVMGILDQLETLFANASNWTDIQLGGNYEVFKFLLLRWSCVRLPDIRTQRSAYIYKGLLIYDVGIHGAVATR